MTDESIWDNEWMRTIRNDPRATHELISQALTACDDDAAWEPVVVLHFRATREVLEAARGLAVSACPLERALAADILGQLGIPKRVYPSDAVGILLTMLNRERDDDALASICIALGHQHALRGIEPLTRLLRHPNARVRHALTHGFMGHDDGRAIAALIELSADIDGEVRNWATFSLGSQIDTDTPAIRESLANRLPDSDDDARGEALVGLARRGDARVIDALLRGFSERFHVTDYEIEAAALQPDIRLYPALVELKEGVAPDSSVHRSLDDAIEKCRRAAPTTSEMMP